MSGSPYIDYTAIEQIVENQSKDPHADTWKSGGPFKGMMQNSHSL